ncbi:MAG: methionyl-tRNA formyltransferase [Clostridia bacterium]|nr:methionyl-tRNA formyltransferase [Clostridia bacterium]
MNIMFMGTPDFALISLKKLVECGYNVTSVVCREDKPKGRGGQMAMPPTKEFAIEKGINVYQPNTFKDGAFAEVLEKENPDIIIVVAYGRILPEYVLNYPKYGCINLHGSALPKYRGSAPIQWTVINGDDFAGVSTMFMDVGLDTGDIIDVYTTPLGENETAGELFDRLALSGAELLCNTVEKIKSGNATRTPQNEDEATYAPILNKEMGKLRFDMPAEKIRNLVRGLNPWPSAYVNTNKGIMKVHSAEVTRKNAGVPAGTRIPSKDAIVIQTSNGQISLTEVQLQGKKRMSAAELLRGHDIVIEE